MARRVVNLGILAHVDAGKTSLTERLLHAAGVIAEVGSVDAGTTVTDSLELERRRGITIRSAVAAFTLGGVAVNLIDTPGHPDFVAEVERVLSVLDGAVLVVSAVEGLQPQTRVLMRVLDRLRVPTLVLVNKIDRGGADDARVCDALAGRAAARVVAMGSTVDVGTPDARVVARPPGHLLDVLTAGSDALLAAYVDDESAITDAQLRDELAAQVRRGLVWPVYAGSARTGAGLDALMHGLVTLLPTDAGDDDAPVSARVFKIERGPAGERVAYARIFAGTVHPHQRLRLGDGVEEKVTSAGAIERGDRVRPGPVRAGEIGTLRGLTAVRVGDVLGEAPPRGEERHFAPPMLETVVVPRHRRDGAALRTALTQLAEQDPLIDVRRDDVAGEVAVSLYGEVQKEVVGATLVADYGIAVDFRASTTLCVERPAGVGTAVETLHGPGNPFLATIGLRIEPAPDGSGIAFRLDVGPRRVPLYVYRSMEGFAASMEQYVRHALRQGRFGWRVTDCLVTMVSSDYSSPDGPPSTRGPLSTAADFRQLTPVVVRRALDDAGTRVCEPVVELTVEFPASATSAVLTALARLGGAPAVRSARAGSATVETLLPVPAWQELTRRLPDLTGGEGLVEARFAGYRPVRGDPPTR